MKTGIIRIGNSRGIRIPKALLEQCGFGDRVQLLIEKNRLVIAPDRSPRQGWAEAFAAARPSEHDELFLDGLANDFDRDEWTW